MNYLSFSFKTINLFRCLVFTYKTSVTELEAKLILAGES